MGEKKTDLLRGTLDLLILKALWLERLHGVGISRRITQITKGAFKVSFGSLFPSWRCARSICGSTRFCSSNSDYTSLCPKVCCGRSRS